MKDKLNLNVHDIDTSQKTQIIDPVKERFTFLSIEFNGKSFFPSAENFEKLKNKIRSLCNSQEGTKDVLVLLTRLKNAVDGWISAFFYTEVERYLPELDYYISRQLFLSLRRFEWRFSNKSFGKIPFKYRQDGESGDCLSLEQRKTSGVPLCSVLLEEKRNSEYEMETQQAKNPKEDLILDNPSHPQKKEKSLSMLQRAFVFIFGQ